MQALKKKALIALRYGGFFLLCFVVSAYFTFPWNALRDRVIIALEQAAPGYKFEVESLSPSWLTGVTMTGVHVRKPTVRSTDEPMEIVLDELTVRVSPIAYVRGIQKVSFDATLGGGEAEGFYAESKTQTELSVDLDAVNLSRFPLLKSSVGLPMNGIANGTVHFRVGETPEEGDGNVDLTVDNLTIGDGRSKLSLGGMSGGITVDTIRAGKLVAKLTVDKGVATVDKFESNGDDLKLDITGDIKLARPLGRSRLGLMAHIEFTDTYRHKSDRTRGLFALLDNAPQLAAARTSDGALQYKVTGNFAGPILPRPAGRDRGKRSGTVRTQRK